MKKIFSIVLALGLVLGLTVVAAPVAADVSEPAVTVSPTTVNDVAEYKIDFDITASLTGGLHYIKIEFPADTTVPAAYDTGDITIEGQDIASGDVSGSGQVVTIITPITLSAPEEVNVVFTIDADIQNPTSADDYTLKVWTEKETTPVESAEYTITSGPVDLYDESMDFVDSYGTIQAAIDDALSDYTIKVVTAGTYTEDLVIPADKDGLEIQGAGNASTTIKGVSLSVWGVSTLPNIEILADGVKIHGFTIQSPDPSGTKFAAGMIIGAKDVEIYDNVFEVMNANDTTNLDDVSQGIVTYNKRAMPGVDVSGLSIHDNAFTNYGTGPIGYEGIYINRDEGTGAITIEDNEFTGDIIRGVTVERSNATISGNTLTPTGGYKWTGVLVMDVGGWYDVGAEAQDNIVITSNTIDGFVNGIKVGPSDHLQVLTNISITNNTIHNSGNAGVLVRASADGVVVNFNSLEGNSVYGVENTDADVELDATCNWWDALDGPGAVGPGSGDKVSEDVLFDPWCVKVELDKGWNLMSSPFIPSDTDIEAVLAGIMDDVISVWHWDTGIQDWLTYVPGGPSDLATMEDGKAYWINMAEAADLLICGTELAVPPSLPPAYDVVVGWNMVGFKSTDTSTNAEDYLDGTEYVRIYKYDSGGWSIVQKSDAMEPGLGYWVAFTEAGTIYP